MTRQYDLSHRIENGMTVFPGDPTPRIVPAGQASAPWRVAELHLGTHTGTHVDAASHYVDGGATIDQYPVERFCLLGVVVEAQGRGEDEPIDRFQLERGLSLLPRGGGLFIRTGWDRFWGTDVYLRHPYLTAEAARAVVAAGAGLVGIDALNVDSTPQATCHAHEILLRNDVLIVENLARLSQLRSETLYRFCLLPLLLQGLDGSPVRAVAWEP
jgi:kynurenine formamidase